MPNNQPPKPKSNNEKLVIGLVVGSVLGFLLYWVLGVVSVHSETIFLILVSVAVVLALLLLVLVWFRGRLIKRFFGKDIEFNTVLDDTQEVIDLISTNTFETFPIEKEKKEKLKDLAPKLINYLIWSNFRNWGLRIFTSFVIGLGGIVTTILIINQNKLFENQNKLFENQNTRVEQQTHLIEADRRSAQVFIMGEVLSDINRELESPSNSTRILSNSLLGRVVSLSRAMKPYRYLENDTLIKTPLSPERGQLLISLIESKIDSAFLVGNILLSADFRNSELKNSRIPKSVLVSVNLMGSDLSNVTLYNSFLNKSNLIDANLKEINLRGASLTEARLNNSNLEGAMLQRAIFKHTDLSKANLSGVEMNNKTDFTDVYSLDSCIVDRRDWIVFALDSIRVKGAEEIYKNYTVKKVEGDEKNQFLLIRKPSIFNF